MSIRIVTNNVPRPVLNAWDLTPKEAKEFDYLNIAEGEGSFFRYRGNVYDLGEFFRTSELRDSELQKWDGYQNDTYFSGVLVRYVDDFESVVVARYIS